MLKDVIRERIQAGKLVIFSSHQMSYVEEFCEDIVPVSYTHLFHDLDMAGGWRNPAPFGRSRMLPPLSFLAETLFGGGNSGSWKSFSGGGRADPVWYEAKGSSRTFFSSGFGM